MMISMGKIVIIHSMVVLAFAAEDNTSANLRGSSSPSAESMSRRRGNFTAQQAKEARPVSESVVDINEAVKESNARYNVGEFSLLLGNAGGIVHVATGVGASTISCASNITKPIPVASAGKWTVAAAIGAAVQQGKFAWENRVSSFVPWWTTNDTDKRSTITFAHLLSHTSGLVTSTEFLPFVGVSADQVASLESLGLAAEVGLWNDAQSLEDTAIKIYEGTRSNVMADPGSSYAYQETHYIIAQYAAMKATGAATWQDFFFEYWGQPLGLHRDVMDVNYASTGHFLSNSDAYGYGFGWPERTQGGEDPNPDGGSQLVVSPCAYARFLTTYTRSGDTMYGASFLDEERIATPEPFPGVGYSLGYGYSLGHWVWNANSTIRHSIGYGGVLPMTLQTATGKKFWAYLNRYQIGDGASSLPFMADLMPALKAFMESASPLKRDVCP